MAKRRQSTVKIFCYTCKRYFEYPAKDSMKTFKAEGHTNEKVAQMDRDLGRQREEGQDYDRRQQGPRRKRRAQKHDTAGGVG